MNKISSLSFGGLLWQLAYPNTFPQLDYKLLSGRLCI